MDDDLQQSPFDMIRLYDKINEGYDVCYANFPEKRQSWRKNFGSWLNGKISEWVVSKLLNIYLSLFKIIRIEIVEIPKKKFIRFHFTGALNTVFGYFLYAASYYLLKNEKIALIIDYLIGALFNYKSSSVIVFSKYSQKRFFFFIAVFMITYFTNYSIIYIFINYYSLNAYLSQLIVLTGCPLTLYFLLRKFVFLEYKKAQGVFRIRAGRMYDTV